MTKFLLILTAFYLLSPINALGEMCAHHHERAPIGVMGDHTHQAGKGMVSYRFMRMEMDGNRDGTDRISKNAVLQNFMVAPTRMTMEMQMVGLMYAPSDTVTLTAMLPYISYSMDHVTGMGATFTTESRGAGDVKLSALYLLRQEGMRRIHLNAGISAPTGSINRKDDTPMGNDQKLPYPMQLGSGTFDLLPGITYLDQRHAWSWGAQAQATIRLGENDNDYTLGNRLHLTSWLNRKYPHGLTGSIRLNGETWGNIDGADPDLNPMMVPTADPDRRGGSRLDLLLGLSYDLPKRGMKAHRLSLEIGTPIYQDLDGPQLETDWLVTAGWQYTW